MVGRFQPSVDWWKTQKRTQRQVRILAVGEEELDLLLGAFRPKMIVHITFHVLLMNSVFPFVPSSGSQFSSEIKSERKSTPPEGVQVTSNQAKYQKRNAPAEGSQIACDQSLERKNAPPKGVQTSSNKSTSEKKNAGGVAP
mmetsp:Transcript_17953/g.34137  ORF Transcript_17953/g.34137 Transcript_17953/m.34137 type:complete len:141 (+) Transcript_17953:192-614(+)